jgi:hypothetical protein
MIGVRLRTRACPCCSRRRPSQQHNLAVKHPDVAAQWHPNLNGDLRPEDVAPMTALQVWWRCPAGHVWKTRVSARTKIKSGCPVCAQQNRQRATDGIDVTHPDLAAQWDPELNGGSGHTAGLDEFAEALSRAQEKWRRAVSDEAVSAEGTQPIMFTPDEMFQAEERALADRWHDTLERNVRELLAGKTSFIVRDEQSRVFAGVLGLARSKHLRVALKRLYNDGTTASDSTGDLWSKRVVVAQAT